MTTEYEKVGERYLLKKGDKRKWIPIQAVDAVMTSLKLDEKGAIKYIIEHTWPSPPAPSSSPKDPVAKEPDIGDEPGQDQDDLEDAPEGDQEPDTAAEDPDDLEDQEKAPEGAQEPDTAAKEPDELDKVLKGLEDEDTPPKTPPGDYYDRGVNQETKERPYDKWTYPELRNEIKDRKIKPKSWKTGNLIKDLRKDDKKRSK